MLKCQEAYNKDQHSQIWKNNMNLVRCTAQQENIYLCMYICSCYMCVCVFSCCHSSRLTYVDMPFCCLIIQHVLVLFTPQHGLFDYLIGLCPPLVSELLLLVKRFRHVEMSRRLQQRPTTVKPG